MPNFVVGSDRKKRMSPRTPTGPPKNAMMPPPASNPKLLRSVLEEAADGFRLLPDQSTADRHIRPDDDGAPGCELKLRHQCRHVAVADEVTIPAAESRKKFGEYPKSTSSPAMSPPRNANEPP